MATTNNKGSRRRAQVKTETAVSEKKISKKKIEPQSRFQPGESGACEIRMWKFTGTRPAQQGLQVEQVVAESLDQALRFMRRRFKNFDIKLVEWIWFRWSPGGLCLIIDKAPLPHGRGSFRT